MHDILEIVAFFGGKLNSMRNLRYFSESSDFALWLRLAGQSLATALTGAVTTIVFRY